MRLLDVVLELPRRDPVPERPLSVIDGIAIHHSGDMGTPQSWAKYHTTPPDQGGPSWGPGATIGYHAAVMRNGTAYKTAYDRDQTPGVANENRHLLHVVLQGNLAQQQLPTPAQMRTLIDLLWQYANAYGIPVDRIRTHAEWQTDPDWATSCPGLPELGAHVRFIMNCGL